MGTSRVLYSYYCRDGTVRTRCARHIERSGPYAIVQWEPAIFNQTRNPRRRCIRCDWETQHGINLEDEGDMRQGEAVGHETN